MRGDLRFHVPRAARSRQATATKPGDATHGGGGGLQDVATRGRLLLVPSGVDLVFVSGVLPDAADPSAPTGSPQRFGDTATQARSAFGKISRELEAFGLTMTDVVKINVYLVGDPRKQGEVDLQGLTQAYLGVYGIRALEKSLPARTTVQVAGLPVPGALVEIEVTAARHPPE